MEIELIQMIARIEGIKIQVETMKAANKTREMNGEALAYPPLMFEDCACEIFDIASSMDKFKED